MSEWTRKARVALCAAAAAFWLPLAGPAPQRDVPALPDLIVVQLPVTARRSVGGPATHFPPLDRCVDGARIVRVGAAHDGAAVLTPEFTAACDPDVSFDGTTIVFAGRRNPGDGWQIWTMHADGSGKTQITRGPGPSLAPVFAGARFYLDDPHPTPQIVFVGHARDPDGFALYGTDPAGATLHRLTFHAGGDFSPAILPNGQVVFSSWPTPGGGYGPDGEVALLSVNIDGTDLMPFDGSRQPPRFKDMAAVSSVGDRVYFVESNRRAWLGAGNLAYVSWRRPRHSYHRLQGDPADSAAFLSPTPLPDGGLLASYRRQGSDSVFAVYRIDPESGRRLEQVFQQPGWHSIDAHALLPRPTPPGRANWLKPGSTTGVFYCLNSYLTDPGDAGEGWIASPGTIRYVRVIEGPAPRILGIAPVEPDGSFHIRVPAETPITFQMLDEEYVALRSQKTWTWVMGNENRGCIGCHEDPELSPPNRLVDAITEPPVDLVLPASRRRTVDFRHEIAPILATRCATAGCHVRGQVEPFLGEPGRAMPESAMRAVYASLLGSPAGGYVVPGRAGESRLIRLLLGREADSPAARHDRPSQRELILLIEWVDLGAAWTSRGTDGGRAP